MGCEWHLVSTCMRPWVSVEYSEAVAAATALFLIYPIGQGSSYGGMPLSISCIFNIEGISYIVKRIQ